MAEISADVKMFSSKGAKLSPADQNLDKVAWVVSSMGKTATHAVIPVLPKGCTGIVGVGRTDEDTGKSALIATICTRRLRELRAPSSSERSLRSAANEGTLVW